ncbi:MAG TPA: hypothetical protein VMV48_14985 [Gallionellaceae bacterium]|nr:hypothetical protein [Gallionellaceae bacterium]
MSNTISLNEIKKMPMMGPLLLFIVALLSGCSSLSTTTTAKNMTRPVMLGPIQHVKSNKKTPLYKKMDFDITVENSIVTSGGQYQQTTYVTEESAEKIDAELMRKLDSPKDKIVVETLFVKSARACFLVFCNSRVDYSGIEGGIYSTTPVSTGSSK